MPLIGAPSIGVKCRDAKGLEQGFELEENVVLTPSEHIRQDFARVMIDRLPNQLRFSLLTVVAYNALRHSELQD